MARPYATLGIWHFVRYTGVVYHANDKEHYHVTVQMISHPSDPRPDAFREGGGLTHSLDHHWIPGPLASNLKRERDIYENLGAKHGPPHLTASHFASLCYSVICHKARQRKSTALAPLAWSRESFNRGLIEEIQTRNWANSPRNYAAATFFSMFNTEYLKISHFVGAITVSSWPSCNWRASSLPINL